MASNSYALISYTDWLNTLVICESHIRKQKLKIVFCKNLSNLCRSVWNSFQPSIHKCIRRVILDLLIINNPGYFDRRTERKPSVWLMTCRLIRWVLSVRVNSEVLLPFNVDLVRVRSPHLYNSRPMRIGHVLFPSELDLFQRILKLRVMFEHTFPFRIHSLKMQKRDSPWMRVFPKLIDQLLQNLNILPWNMNYFECRVVLFLILLCERVEVKYQSTYYFVLNLCEVIRHWDSNW